MNHNMPKSIDGFVSNELVDPRTKTHVTNEEGMRGVCGYVDSTVQAEQI